MSRVLVVDDDAAVASFLADALSAVGHDVRSASSTDGALDLARRLQFDVIVTDLKMPGADGMALLRTLRAEQPDVEVIVLTAHGTVAGAVEAMKLGAFDFLEKPLPGPEVLRHLVARAGERRGLLLDRERAERDAPQLPPLSFGDAKMSPVVDALRRVARAETTVLLLGESGTGKEVAARSLHAWSPRRDGPFMAVNCATLSGELLESELFGHERGAFTGAHALRRGRLELAGGGTFFLDEVAELPLPQQAKLLRVIEDRTFERVGGGRSLSADVRWVAATNADLEQLVAEGRFRTDLYHRLSVFPVLLPPLRERTTDVPFIARYLLQEHGKSLSRPHLRLSDEAEQRLRGMQWLGNIRELRNALERAAILTDGDVIGASALAPARTSPSRAPASELPSASSPAPAEEQTLDRLERDAIERALAGAGGNRRRAAVTLGIGLRTLYEKLRRYNLR